MAQVLIPLALTVGGMVLQSVFAPKQKNEGQRLADTNVPAVSPGNPIIWCRGQMKLNGQLLWTSKLIETKHEQSSGGKGGGGGGGTTQIYYTYSVDCAIGFAQGPIQNVKRIRANQKLIWVNPTYESEQAQAFTDDYQSETSRLIEEGVSVDEAHVSGFFFAFNAYRLDSATPGTASEAKAYVLSHPVDGSVLNAGHVNQLVDRLFVDMDTDATYESYKKRYTGIAIYLGSSQQLPDPTIESYKGVGNVPAYRGTAYAVFKGLQLEDFGNTIPTFQFEVVADDGTVYLHEIIADICRESGMSDDEFNVTCGLQTIPVHGFAVTDRQSGRDILQQLQRIYPFDATETAYTLRFGWIEKRPQALIRREDFGAHVIDDDMPPSEEIVRAQDFDLPQMLTLKYQEPARNYSINTAIAQRMVTQSNLVEDISTTIALDRTEAKSRIEAALAYRFFGRRSYKVTLPRKYVILEPGDVVLVPEADNPNESYGLRVVEAAIGANGLIEFTFNDHHYQSYIEAIASEDIVGDDDVEDGPAQGSRTYCYMLDLPLLTDAEADNIGFYTMLSGIRAGWSGGVLIVDFGSGGIIPVFEQTSSVIASGSTWYTAARNTVMVAHGFVMNLLGNAVPCVWDLSSTITVKLLNPEIALASYTQADLLTKPFNVAVVGDEIIQFADATDKGNGIWELKTLLRGLRGTEWAIKTHELGETFVMLDAAGLQRVVHATSQLNAQNRYRSLSIGENPEDALDILFTNTGNSLRPYAPFVHSKVRSDDGTVAIRWLPRVRQNGGLINGKGTVLDQPFESYEIQVFDGDTMVRRETTTGIVDTFFAPVEGHEIDDNSIPPEGGEPLPVDWPDDPTSTGGGSDSVLREWVYPASAQTTDFGEPQDSLRIRLYQIGQTIGRGFGVEIVV